MSSVLEMLNQSLSQERVRQISNTIGADENATSTAISGALPVLIQALSRNTASSGGASGLLAALDRDHDGSILDDLGGFLGSASAGPGEGILGHILGNRRGNVENGLSRMSGLDPASIARLMTILAPIVMGVLGRAKRQDGLDATGLAAALGREKQAAERAAPDAMNMFAQLLDTDGDGEVMDNVAQLGTSLLGKFLSSRR